MSEEVKKTKSNVGDVFDNSKSSKDSDNDNQDRERVRRPRRRKTPQNLKCPLCEAGVKDVTYKDIYQLKKFTSVKGKIISTEKSGVCNRHQRKLKRAIKRARYMSLLPYSLEE